MRERAGKRVVRHRFVGDPAVIQNGVKIEAAAAVLRVDRRPLAVQRGSTVEVEGVYVSGPLYGRDPWPHKFLTTSQFRTRFTRYHESQRSVIWEGKYVIVSE